MTHSLGEDYHAFFSDLVARFQTARPEVELRAKITRRSYYTFGGDRTGFRFFWAFTSRKEFQTELYIDLRDRNHNLLGLAELEAQRVDIERQVGAQLNWLSLAGRRGCRISATVPGTVHDPPEHLEQLKVWAVDTMAKFVDVFRPRVKLLRG
jgi:hypothetical protein